MKKLKGMKLAAGVAAMAMMATVGCSGETSGESSAPADTVSLAQTEETQNEKGSFSIGVTCKDLTIEAYASISKYLEGYSQEAGYSITVVSASNDPAKQVEQIENFVTGGTDVIIVMDPCDVEGISPSVKEAVEAGVPVIGYGYAIDGNSSELICVNYSIGYQSGEQAVKWAQENNGGKGEFALLHLTLSSEPCYDRYNGSKDAVSELGGDDITIVAEQAAQTIDEALNVAESIMEAHPELDGFICNSGGAGFGSNEAIKAEGKIDSMAVFCCDTTADILDTLRNEDNNAIRSTICVGSDTFMANKLFEICQLIQKGEPYEAHYDAETKLITPENVEQYIIDNNLQIN